MLVLLACGQWVAFALATIGLMGITVLAGRPIASLGHMMFATSTNYILCAIPLFVLMGEFFLHGGMSELLYRGISPWVRRAPGGLLLTNIAACAVFGAMSGSSVACAATIGKVAIPEQLKRGYEPKMVLGSVAAGGTLATLIPPSNMLIIYGWLAQQSVAKLYTAAMIPGIIVAIALMICISVQSALQPRSAPKGEPVSWKERMLTLKDLWVVGAIIFAVLGGIYVGVTTPTEGGAIGAFLGFCTVVVRRRLSWQLLKNVCLATTQTTCMIMFIMVGATLLSNAIAYLGVSAWLAEAVTGWSVPPLLLLAGIYLMYIFLGMFIDPVSMIVLTLPFVLPVIIALGYSPIWLGVVLVVLCEVALISPPVGLNLFVIQGIAREYPSETVIRGIFPFFMVLCCVLALFTLFPQIILWLPSLMSAK